ncbi:NAD(P)-dependent dehydrogenase (short-subunit alcohol dehydrogenase family) [Microbacterium endophyticum]|uniref:3beta-hydroxysteroid 3-dehydrogenase n=1 Tax=Microbacterium endophyticum TaxID=1526412 RepID=A0A7W4V527_9MICO|nr:SDR family NAD(P)-dependent oxidoreductase [Microbacterium endophyticum]MBB2976859.1 NAD(P)-dependent dehydrogenase (short-subunit alcohol dehydrogenase family) [Microbacterium endophyticum]NIK35823.1 NAD(P)-dependent dehydrogenase (short-subunit alcohol dehydrogenase family) [Microbacterium endophyticum]
MSRRAADWNPRLLPDLTGRTYLVTGSNAGLGFFSSEQLARAGARVIMTGRSPNRLAAARNALLSRVTDATTTGPVETLLLDTSNLGSVRAAAASVKHMVRKGLRFESRIDGLLLNAGTVHPPKERCETLDGNELVFATNVLGHFALAGELLPALAAAEGRMVWLGSMSTSMGPYDPIDPQLVKDYSPWRAYVQSKVATTALGLEADRRLRDTGVPVESVIAHPGYAISGRTPFVRGVNEPTRRARFVDNLQAPITQSKEHGAWPLVRALVDPDVEGGEMWGPKYVMHGEPRRTTPSRITRSTELGDRLWHVCEKAAQVRWPFEKAARA